MLLCVCARCYAGLEGGDRGGDGSVYCPSRRVRAEGPRGQRGRRTPPLREAVAATAPRTPASGAVAWAESAEDEAPLRSSSPRAQAPRSRQRRAAASRAPPPPPAPR